MYVSRAILIKGCTSGAFDSQLARSLSLSLSLHHPGLRHRNIIIHIWRICTFSPPEPFLSFTCLLTSIVRKRTPDPRPQTRYNDGFSFKDLPSTGKEDDEGSLYLPLHQRKEANRKIATFTVKIRIWYRWGTNQPIKMSCHMWNWRVLLHKTHERESDGFSFLSKKYEINWQKKINSSMPTVFNATIIFLVN